MARCHAWSCTTYIAVSLGLLSVVVVGRESDAIRNSTKLRGSLTTSIWTTTHQEALCTFPCTFTAHKYTHAIERSIKVVTKSGRCRMFVIRAALNDDIALPWAILRTSITTSVQSSRLFLVTSTSPASPAFATPFFYLWKGTREAPLISRWNQKGTECRTKHVSNVVKAILGLGPCGGFYMMPDSEASQVNVLFAGYLPNLYVQN